MVITIMRTITTHHLLVQRFHNNMSESDTNDKCGLNCVRIDDSPHNAATDGDVDDEGRPENSNLTLTSESAKRVTLNASNGNGLSPDAAPNDAAVKLGSCSGQSSSESCGQSLTSAHAVLMCRQNSHPFDERRLALDTSAKVGRAVARCKPSADNSIFDCKVLSRNHALLWYENGKFFLKDTRSSNGTFINNQRLSPANEESTAREVCSGDVVQFGVDVMENSRRVTHGCIIATIKLYLPDGTEAKASRITPLEESQFTASQMQNFQANNICISSQELYQLSQYLTEALHREQILENKLTTLQRVVTNAQETAHSGWKCLVEEDRLLSRIETLQSKLEVCLNSSKTIAADSSTFNIKEDMLKLIEEKEKYECAAKEAIQKALEEKLLVLTRLHALEATIKSSEDECNRLQEVCEASAKEINRLANCNDDLNKEIEDFVKRLKAADIQKSELTETAKKEKQALEERIVELRARESEMNELIVELKGINESANLTIEKLKLQLVVIKQEKVINSDGISDNSNELKLSDELRNVQKLLESSTARCNELTAHIELLKSQHTVSGLSINDLSNNVNNNNDNNNTTQALINGEINNSNNSTNDNKNSANCVNDFNEELVVCNSGLNASTTTTTSNASHFNSEVDVLKELLAETRSSKKSLEGELSRSLAELENVTKNMKKFELEVESYQQKLNASLKEIEEKCVLISTMKNQFNEANEKLSSTRAECETHKRKIDDNERSLQLKDEEINSLKVLLEEERKVQLKYSSNLEQCRKQLLDVQHLLKQSQTEVEFLRKKVYSVNEELRSSRSNLSANDESSRLSKEFDKLKSDYITLQSKLHNVETELISYRDSNRKIQNDYERLQLSHQALQALNEEIESKGDEFLREQLSKTKSVADVAQTELSSVKTQLETLRQNFDDYSQENVILKDELKSAREDYEIVSYQTKIATACAIVPLIFLLIAVLMAYYPSVSSVTGTTDL